VQVKLVDQDYQTLVYARLFLAQRAHTAEQLQSKLAKSEERNRAFQETFQNFTDQVSKIL
jgi:SOS response regulatory protein OraA/RecX